MNPPGMLFLLHEAYAPKTTRSANPPLIHAASMRDPLINVKGCVSLLALTLKPGLSKIPEFCQTRSEELPAAGVREERIAMRKLLIS